MVRAARAAALPLLATAVASWGAVAFMAPKATARVTAQPSVLSEVDSSLPEALLDSSSAPVQGASLRSIALGAALGFAVAVAAAPAAHAGDPKKGEEVFGNICVACHAGGNNLVATEKTLKVDALQANGRNDANMVKAIVAGGKGAMPALGQVLSAEEIDDVASYVMAQSSAGWK